MLRALGMAKATGHSTRLLRLLIHSVCRGVGGDTEETVQNRVISTPTGMEPLHQVAAATSSASDRGPLRAEVAGAVTATLTAGGTVQEAVEVAGF
jgi:hypothetical protein